MASMRKGKDGIERLMSCIVSMPCHPIVWRQQLQRAVAQTSEAVIAGMLEHSVERLRARLADTNEEYTDAQIRRYYEANPTYTLEELAKALKIPAELMRGVVHGPSGTNG